MSDPASATAPASAPDSSTPAASDLLKPPATPPTTPEAWEARRVELIGDPHFRNAYLSGDIEAQKRMKEVFAGLNPKVDLATAEGREYAARQEALTPLKMTSALPPEFWDGLARGTPVTLAERQWALETKEQCFKDKGWVRTHRLRHSRPMARLGSISARPSRPTAPAPTTCRPVSTALAFHRRRLSTLHLQKLLRNEMSGSGDGGVESSQKLQC